MFEPIEITVDSEAVLLLRTVSSWSSPVTLTATMQSKIVRTLTGRELAYKLDHKPRWELQAPYVVADEVAAAWRSEISVSPLRRVAVPLWVHLDTQANYGSRWLDAPYWFRLDTGAVVAAAAVAGLPAATLLCPVLFGRIEQRPDLSAAEDWVGEFSIRIREDAPVAWAVTLVDRSLDPNEFPTGLTPSWSRVSDTTLTQLETRSIGQGRQSHLKTGGGLPYFSQVADFELRRSQAADLLDFFRLQGGRAGVFTAPSWFRPGTVATHNPIGYSGRFTAESLTLQFNHPQSASAQLKLREVPDPSQSETLEMPVYLYRFSYGVPASKGGPLLELLTSFEDTITHSAEAYAPARIEHDTIRLRKKAGESRTTIKTSMVDAPMLRSHALRRGEAELSLEIFEAHLSGSPAPRSVFKGIAGAVRIQDRAIQIEFGEADKANFPSVHVQRTDNLAPWSAVQGADIADYEEAATIELAINSHRVGVSIDGGDTFADDYFTWGVLEVGTGATWQRRIIVSQEPNSGSEFDRRMELDRPLYGVTYPIAATVTPGYTGQWGYRLPVLDSTSQNIESNLVYAYFETGYFQADGFAAFFFLDGPDAAVHAAGTFEGGWVIVRGEVFQIAADAVDINWKGTTYKRRISLFPPRAIYSKTTVILLTDTYTREEVEIFAEIAAQPIEEEGDALEFGAAKLFRDDGSYRNFLGVPFLPGRQLSIPGPTAAQQKK